MRGNWNHMWKAYPNSFLPSHWTPERGRRRCCVYPETPETARRWWRTSRPLSGLSLLHSRRQSTGTGTPEHKHTKIGTSAGTKIHTNLHTVLLRPYLPADRVDLVDLLDHVFVNIEGIDDRVDFESHFILLAPVANLVKVVQVALPALSSANQLVGCFIKTVTGDGQDV